VRRYATRPSTRRSGAFPSSRWTTAST
jgi:hypothetical protein